jgi:uncharacterized membrane protein YkgB
MEIAARTRLSLFLLRIGVFIVMLMWTLDKFVQPDHAAKVFKGFYGIGVLSNPTMYLIGAIELVIIVGFVAGFMKRWTYGAVLVLHAISTLASFGKYVQPFSNLLFFAAWPMLAACIALYLLRDSDTLLAIKK